MDQAALVDGDQQFALVGGHRHSGSWALLLVLCLCWPGEQRRLFTHGVPQPARGIGAPRLPGALRAVTSFTGSLSPPPAPFVARDPRREGIRVEPAAQPPVSDRPGDLMPGSASSCSSLAVARVSAPLASAEASPCRVRMRLPGMPMPSRSSSHSWVGVGS